MIALLTTGRHDMAYLTPIYEAMRDEAVFCGLSDSQCATDLDVSCKAVGAMGMVTKFINEVKPTRLVVLGDRTETLAACVAATCMKIPIAQIHGGDVTLGAIDNVCRHAISQLADMHFAATQDALDRLYAMQVPGPKYLTGSPAIDMMMRKKRERVPGKHVLLGFHPETLSDVDPVEQVKVALLEAFARMPNGGKVIFLGANPDAGGAQINNYVQKIYDAGALIEIRTNMGCEAYWDLLATCHCLVGNTSSGVIEAPALGVPFIEIGDRQKGRYRGSYGDGKATERIVAVLRAWLSSVSSPQPAP